MQLYTVDGLDGISFDLLGNPMIWRALCLLVLVITASVLLTLMLGHEVLLALGLIATQIKLLIAKASSLKLPTVLAWLKTEAHLFFRVELIKKWVYSSLVPLVVGSAILRRLKLWMAGYIDAVRSRYRAMIDWYGRLGRAEKVVATLIVVFATLALTVSTLGLWLVLFTVQLPLWVLAAAAAAGKSVWLSARKSLFKTLAFFQLGWLWRLIRGRLPKDVLEKKRRLDFRLARRVIRSRKMTLRQVTAGKDGLALRLALIRARLRGERET